MENVTMQNNLFHPENMKAFEVNNCTDNATQHKNFTNGLRNARNILHSLERSIQKTNQYERRLLQCKARHPHMHSVKDMECSKTEIDTKCSRSQVDLAESWSTMSIVCLRYQYEELSSRYEALLRAYDERCSAMNNRELLLTKLRSDAADAHARILESNRALLAVGDLYLKLRDKSLVQKTKYTAKISSLKQMLASCLMLAEKARIELDTELASKMAAETDAARSMLLAEIRKCNRLCLENMRLKNMVEKVCK